MRKYFISLCISVICLCGFIHYGYSQSYNQLRPQGYVNDFAGVIDNAYEQKIESFCAHVEKSTTAEISVVTVGSLDGEPIELYAVKLFERWGIGKKGKDNGVLVLVVPQERMTRIEVGYGLEGVLPDGLCGEIIDTQMLPSFRQGNFGEGVFRTLINVTVLIGKEYNVDVVGSMGIDQNSYHIVERRSPFATLVGKLLYLIFLILILGTRFWFFPFLFGFPFGGYWSGGGHYRGGGGFSGGFGGFGGGLSGGGGASRSW